MTQASIDGRGQALFEALNEDRTRVPKWSVQPEHLKVILREHARSDVFTHRGTGKIYDWTGAEFALRQ